MRISDWSSDVCSSDLRNEHITHGKLPVERSEQHGTGSRAYGWRRNGGRSVATASPAMMRPEGAGADLSRPMASNAHHAWTSCNQRHRSEEHTSELQSLMRNPYAVFSLKKKTYTH